MNIKQFACFILIATITLGCGKTKNYVPFSTTQIDNFHCWPYDVMVYNIKDFTSNEQLDGYPTVTTNKKRHLLKWSNVSDYLHTNKDSIIFSCDDENGGLNNLKQDITNCYISGIYRIMKTENNKTVNDFTTLAIIDPNKSLLYLFEDVNYSY